MKIDQKMKITIVCWKCNNNNSISSSSRRNSNNIKLKICSRDKTVDSKINKAFDFLFIKIFILFKFQLYFYFYFFIILLDQF